MDMKTFWKEKTDKKVKAFIVVPALCYIIGSIISAIVVVVSFVNTLNNEGKSIVVAILVIVVSINVVLGLYLLISKSKGVAIFLVITQALSTNRVFSGQLTGIALVESIILLALAILAVIGTFQFHNEYAAYKLNETKDPTILQ